MRWLHMQTGLVGITLTLATAGGVRSAEVDQDAILIYSSGLDGILVDAKDGPLREALGLLDERVMELPAETGEEMPAHVIKVVLDMLRSPLTLRAGMMEGADPDAGPPIRAQLVVECDDDETARRQALVLFQALSQSPLPVDSQDHPDVAGMKALTVAGVPAYLGATRMGKRPATVIAVNRLDVDAVEIGSGGLADGVEPAVLVRIDGERLAPLLDMLVAKAPPREADLLRMQLALCGFAGETPMSLEAACGYGPDLAHTVIRCGNFATSELYGPLLLREAVRERDLAMIPEDATYAEVWRADLAALPQVVRRVLRHLRDAGVDAEIPELDEMLASFADVSGVHLETDLLEHLGTATGSYMARSTGGGGLTSLCMFVELRDPERFRDGLERLYQFFNEMAAARARGYVRIVSRSLRNRPVTTLLFPGVPVPLEVSWTIEGEHLIVAASPQALLAALEQAAPGGSSILDNARFRELAAGVPRDAMGLEFYDTPELAAEGYGLLSLGAAALANAMRAPGDPERGPALVLPTYADLLEDARGSLTACHLEDADLVITMQADRSALVNLAALAGIVGGASSSAPLAALWSGVMLPSVGKAREQAVAAQSMAQLRQIATAVMIHAAEHNDELPASLTDLVEAGYCTEASLKSPYGSVPEGGDDYWLNRRVKRMAHSKRPDQHVLAYDRSSYRLLPDHVHVAFFDGHVEQIDKATFHELMSSPEHEGVDFELPGH